MMVAVQTTNNKAPHGARPNQIDVSSTQIAEWTFLEIKMPFRHDVAAAPAQREVGHKRGPRTEQEIDLDQGPHAQREVEFNFFPTQTRAMRPAAMALSSSSR